jgi:hypothetical protein
MTNIRPDAIVFSNLTEAYINYLTTPSTIVIPADTIADTDGRIYQTTVSYTRGGTRADIYLQRDDTGLKILASSGRRIAAELPTYQVYQFTGSEVCEVYILYNPSTIDVILGVRNNTGGPITLIPQTITVSAVFYDAPITPI